MSDIIANLNDKLNTTASSIREILYEFSCDYSIRKEQLPSSDVMMELLASIPDQDVITITFSAGEDISCVTKGNTLWIDEYEDFVRNIFGDSIAISIKIEKKVSNGILSIYNLNSFQEFLSGCTVEAHLANFTKLFKECGEHVNFRLLDTNGSLRTNSIVFSDNDIQWRDSERSRDELIKNCDDACVFLDRTQIRLIPQDFLIQYPVDSNAFQSIIDIFEKLERVLSFVYLANTSSIHQDKAVLYFNPVGSGCEYALDRLASNDVITQIYHWIFKDDSCVDKASIARKIINVYCRTEDEILSIDQKVFNSIKSDFQIYQKNHVEQYIDMKNKISDHIVESAKQIQELSHELSDAVRNNFVAIIVFIMTVFLTESIDFSQLLEKSISPRITAVCCVFTGASLLYMIVTWVTSNQKWQWLYQSYKDLKENYKKTLDDADIEEAFSYDVPLQHAKEQYDSFKKIVMRLWGIAIVAMAIFTCVLFFNGSSNDVVTQSSPCESVTEKDTETIVAEPADEQLSVGDLEEEQIDEEQPIGSTVDEEQSIGVRESQKQSAVTPKKE